MLFLWLSAFWLPFDSEHLYTFLFWQAIQMNSSYDSTSKETIYDFIPIVLMQIYDETSQIFNVLSFEDV